MARHFDVCGIPRLIALAAAVMLSASTMLAAEEAAPPTGSSPVPQEPAALPSAPPAAKRTGHRAKPPKVTAAVAPHPQAKPEIVTPSPSSTPAAPEAPQAPVPAAPSVQAGPVAPQQNGASIGELEPVLHARSAKITTCMDHIVAQASSVIDRPHTAVSTWVSQDPNAHAFQSIIGLSYPNKTAPNGAAVIFAAPVSPTTCEGGTVQIYPSAEPCSVIQGALIKSGRTLATLQNLPVVETSDGARNVLMPTAGSGCVVVSVRAR